MVSEYLVFWYLLVRLYTAPLISQRSTFTSTIDTVLYKQGCTFDSCFILNDWDLCCPVWNLIGWNSFVIHAFYFFCSAMLITQFLPRFKVHEAASKNSHWFRNVKHTVAHHLPSVRGQKSRVCIYSMINDQSVMESREEDMHLMLLLAPVKPLDTFRIRSYP